MTTPVPDDDFTELVDARIDRVDLVDQAANGTAFLIAKQRGGALLDPAYVRELVGKADPQPGPITEQVTLIASPAAVMRMIHSAAVASPIAKETPTMADDATDLDPTTPLAEPAEGATGQATVPGSPAWEATDAATARKWTAILARAKNAIALLSEREMIEAASADPDDAFAAMDLDDAACAIDYAISVLAPFAVAEQAEADCASDMEMVGKALTGFDILTDSLATIEALGTVRKAGRTLSARNEATIRSAVEALNGVLASLPPAPEDSGRPVAKTTQETPVPEPETTPAADTAVPDADVTKTAEPAAPAAPVEEPAPAPAAAAAGVVKAKPQTAVYDRSGRLVGVVDPGSITMVADDSGDEPAQEPEPVAEAAMPAADAAAEPIAEGAAPSLDLEPAPADGIGTPSSDMTKTTGPTPDAESSTADMAKQADDRSTAQEQVIAKQATDLAELVKTVEALKAQVLALEEQPAESKVFANGAVPPQAPAHARPQLRGQDQGAPPMGIAEGREMKKGLYGAADATEQNAIANGMQAAAIAALSVVHHGGSVPQ